MLFNSIDFAVFLPIVFALYWSLSGQRKTQNLLLLIASYVFYGWWDWRFLALLLVSTLVDYSVGLKLYREDRQTKRKALLAISIVVNLGLLAFFKYYNFFLDNFTDAFSLLGGKIEARSLNVILPLGISFYTFQTLSYTLDIYRRKIAPTQDFIGFSAFVSFFPQLVAGPIERASNLLPQFSRKRTFNYARAVDGTKQILWGLFKKMVIADGCAEYANLIFNNTADYHGSTLALGALFFAFQIYGDFSGYSDIAIGTARLFGFNLTQNFAFPYFSRSIAEFWRRWHISLSTWFRDYLYIPLGGSRGGLWMKTRNAFIVFVVCGFWHGANWTFIVWGALNALYFLPLLLTNRNRKNLDTVAQGRIVPTLKEGASIVLTFTLTTFAWIFFRAENMDHAMRYIGSMFSTSLLARPEIMPWPTLMLMALFMVAEWLGREDQYAIARIGSTWRQPLRYLMYYAIVLAIFWLSGHEQQFIYFQF